MAERVQVMMSKNLKHVDIRLDPPELGRLHIRMNMHGDRCQRAVYRIQPAGA